MPDGVGDNRLDLRELLAAVEAASPIEAVDVLAHELALMVDATEVSLLLANFSGDAVARIAHVTTTAPDTSDRREWGRAVALAGSTYERVLVHQALDVQRGEGTWTVLLPVTERGDAIGVLELTLPRAPGRDEVSYLESAAHALAYVLVASRRHTDLYEWAQRDTPFSLSAEIQRRLLPTSYTIETAAFTLAGWLEPASTVGGDTFDYSVDRDYLYASITDAMGHSTEAALLATLTVASLRNSRRSLASPGEQAAIANQALLECSDADQFVTGLLVRVRLADGRVELVNAGHPPPFHLRRGRCTPYDIGVDPALGVVAGTYATEVSALEPGDRLLLVTDGFLERNAVQLDIATMLEATADRHPRQVVQELSGQVLSATGNDLRDDATVLCLDWYGPAGRRDATAGSSRERATRD